MILNSVGADAQVVVPDWLADQEGNFNNNIPFSDEAPVRYQQVFLGSEVGLRVDMHQIRYRQDSFWGEPFTGTIPEMTIMLSSTLAGPDDLSMLFSENLGPDAMVVYSGPLRLGSESTGSTPHRWDVRIDLHETFDFDPAGGLNLLMDVTIPAGPELTPFDAEHTEGDSVSRAYCWVFEECLTTDEVMITDTVGLVTMFLDQAVFRDFFESGDTSAWSVTVD